MPQFAYRAVDAQGVMNKGEALAANENELFAKLHQQGLSLVDCRSDAAHAIALFKPNISLAEQVLLCRHLVMLTKAGVPVHIALQDILPALPKHLRHSVSLILHHITQGQSLSAAFSQSNAQFDALFSLLLSAGEKTGRISEALVYLYESLNWKREYQEKLKRALSYPIFQMLLAGMAVTVLMVVAVPQIISLLEMIGEQLPLSSLVVLWGMKILGGAIILGITASLLLALFLPLIKKMHQDIAIAADKLFLSLPVIGKLFKKVELAQLTHVCAAMLSSGIQMMDALQLLPNLTRNQAMAESLRNVAKQVGSGQELSAVLTKQLVIPAYVIRILKIGEDSGKMADSLRHIAHVYQEESGQALDELLRISSLFITLAVGLILVLMVSGIMGPLYRGISHMVAI